uniref:N-fatty-acyl-amino acid synthase/hydrolase PM20D1 n=1 Tax=Petromyzon marinus TaxID=7757 RepID=A0AAJ7X1R7_PETMA|nr:N-fatty-acyl-amino acid synthase/hydrolase PM20D1 [Petromyzon marinus]
MARARTLLAAAAALLAALVAARALLWEAGGGGRAAGGDIRLGSAPRLALEPLGGKREALEALGGKREALEALGGKREALEALGGKREALGGKREARACARLRAAVRVPTVSREGPGAADEVALLRFGRLLREEFPAVFESELVTHDLVANFSHLLTVRGADGGRTPYMLTAHLDVVPAPDYGWDVPPFSGEIHQGYIYGRGTIDDKHSLMAILEALELLLQRGFVPQRTFYIGIGHDEEIGGDKGARNIAKVLESRGVKLDFLLDEGMVILDGVVPGLQIPVAVVGVSEKGSLMLRLRVRTETGHSSMPAKESCIGILSAAITRLESNPLPQQFGSGPERALFEYLSPQFNFPMRVVTSNLWLFGPIFSWVLGQKPTTNALIRTTTAVTEFHAGVKPNVVAPLAEATVNYRIHPAQSVSEVLRLTEEIIADDRVELEVLSSMEPLPISPFDESATGYWTISKSITDTFPDIVSAPGLCIANTDTRHYQKLTSALYRFTPVWNKLEDIPRYHGVNERISLQNYKQTIHFYFNLMQNADQEEPLIKHFHTEDL